jgi:hypothetical protein
MARFDGSVAPKVDFGEWTTTALSLSRGGRVELRLAARPEALRGPDKYKVLEQRRRRAQIRARRLLDLL